MKSPLLQIIRQAQYEGKTISTAPMLLDPSLLDIWLLNRIGVPAFEDADQMKRFVTAINLLIEPLSAGVVGPVGYAYSTDLTSIDTSDTATVTLLDGAELTIEVKKYSMWDETQPSDHQTLRNILQEERGARLPVKSYGSYFANSVTDKGPFDYESLCVEPLIPFLSNYQLDQSGQSNLTWLDGESGLPVDVGVADMDDHWSFMTEA